MFENEKMITYFVRLGKKLADSSRSMSSLKFYEWVKLPVRLFEVNLLIQQSRLPHYLYDFL